MSGALLRGRWLRCFIYQIEGIVKTNCWWLGSPPVFAATWLLYDHRSRVTWTHRLWVFLRISTTWVDTGTPSFQTVVKHQQQSAKKKKPHLLSGEQKWTLAAFVLRVFTSVSHFTSVTRRWFTCGSVGTAVGCMYGWSVASAETRRDSRGTTRCRWCRRPNGTGSLVREQNDLIVIKSFLTHTVVWMFNPLRNTVH